jgi:uncharacterized protein (TIGR03435 family)
MTVTVVGTVFLVNADAEGSRVAVIEGEVRVQQGATETKLRPGERVASNAKTFTVASELAWSRRAAELAALLKRQSAAEQRPSDVAPPGEPRVAFEVISIRAGSPAGAPAPGARGGGGANSRPNDKGCSFTTMGFAVQIDPRRFAVTRATLFHLIAWAYPVEDVPARSVFVACDNAADLGLITGGPEWIKTDVWDIQASIPEGIFGGRPAEFDPKIQQMLQALLAERAKLTLRRETKQQAVYLLTQADGGAKFNGRRPLAPGQSLMVNDASGSVVQATPEQEAAYVAGLKGLIRIRGQFDGFKVTMSDLAQEISRTRNRPVFDRTGLTGAFDFHLDMRAPALGGTPRANRPGVELETALRTIGLQLEESTSPLEVWVVDRVEKPSEN